MYFTHFSPSGTDGKWTSLGNSSMFITGYAWMGTIRFSSAWKLEKKYINVCLVIQFYPTDSFRFVFNILDFSKLKLLTIHKT